MATPFRLTDSQLQLLLAAAKPLDPDKRGLFLERVGAHLRCNCSGHPSDADVEAAVAAGLRGLQQQARPDDAA